MEHREAYLGSSQTQTSGRELLYEKCQRFLAVNIKHVFDYTILSSSFGRTDKNVDWSWQNVERTEVLKISEDSVLQICAVVFF